jgi:histidinol phosphatase-like PHP family hydrolase
MEQEIPEYIKNAAEEYAKTIMPLSPGALQNMLKEVYTAGAMITNKQAEHWKAVSQDLKQAMLFADKYSVIFENDSRDDVKYKKWNWQEIAKILYEDLKHGFSSDALKEDLEMYETAVKEQL